MNEVEFDVWGSLFSPGKKKRKKKAKPSPHEMLTQKPNDDAPKKKKKSKYKEATDKRKAKKKAKKKEKQSKHQDRLANPCLDEIQCKPPECTGQVTKSKRKKRVAFDLSQNLKKAKRPKLPVEEPIADRTTNGQIQPSTNESQSLSDDMQSQDLFITQKTFQLPPSEVSSEEMSGRTEDNARAMEVSFRETREECVLFETKKLKKSDLYQRNVKSSPGNPFLEEPIVLFSSPDADKKAKNFPARSQCSPSSRQSKSLASAFTQTENFFTTELSMYLRFCKKNKVLSDEPLDLSLPHRARSIGGGALTMSTKDEHEDVNPQDVIEISDEGCDRQSLCGQRKEATLSSASENDSKSADTTVSSEDSEAPCRTTRLELMQIRAVQMRLNESFFFKTKGEKPSPRPESPLMKLIQGREHKSHKN